MYLDDCRYYIDISHFSRSTSSVSSSSPVPPHDTVDKVNIMMMQWILNSKHSIYPPLQQCPPSISFSLLASLGPETSTAKLAIGVESCTDLPGRDYGEQHQLAGGTVTVMTV